MFIGQETAYVSGYNEPNSTSDKPTPRIEKLKTGTSIWLKPHLTPDKENVYLDFKSETTQIQGFKERTYLDKYTHKIPQINTVTIATGHQIPLGKTLFIIGRLFGNPSKIKEQRTLLILVKPKTGPIG